MKRIMVIMLIAGFFCSGLVFYLRAQNPPGEDYDMPDFSSQLKQLEAKMDSLSAKIDNTNTNNKEISSKLDRVLSNQDQIIKELEIVKVRASVKR